jgi:hypothetical protein
MSYHERRERRNYAAALKEETATKHRLEEQKGREKTNASELEDMRLLIEKLELDSNARHELEVNEIKKKAQLDLARSIARGLVVKIQNLLMQLKEKKALLVHLGEIGDTAQLAVEQDIVAEMFEKLKEANKQSARNLAAQQAKQARAEQENRDYHAAAGSRDVEETEQRRSKHWKQRYDTEPHAVVAD